ncbi:metal-sensitive transcriptional regulator [Halobacteriovorax sp. GB3]|uniref:metal-sensitive transcriptional regulator n=1 Tax=Halobacteriovorax sp. GB3 TaxID=2719615 RepID=UPI00235F88F8|nr:metal-sensitive transcriptional regulator [Halobacteriovorax sp. GB3]MDD0851747.1 metal-sensitive transcriptional regulator [Halobacteriovorax sp. GB3]
MKGANHKALLNRIKRIEGQVRGLANMVESEKYCIDILTQIKAQRSALKSLELEILENHLHHCVKEAIDSGDNDVVDDKINEVLEILKKSSKS